MGDIKSALEIAMEKVEKLGKATDEERLRWEYVPEGERLAAKYLKQDSNLTEELGKYDREAARYVMQGAGEVLIRNISLPRNDLAKKTNKRAMEGLKMVKNNKVDVENVYSKIRHIFNHYVEQGKEQRREAYESLKAEVEARLQQAVQQRLGSSARVRIDVERQPQFQEEWHKMQIQLDRQYLKLLDEYKQELLAIT